MVASGVGCLIIWAFGNGEKTLMFVGRGAAYAHQIVPLTYICGVKYQGFSSSTSVGEVLSNQSGAKSQNAILLNVSLVDLDSLPSLSFATLSWVI
jgi:hypothetical protein